MPTEPLAGARPAYNGCMAKRRTAEAGVTFLELVVVIALIAVIAAIAIPSFLSTQRKTTASSEVNQFFTEMRVRQEEWVNENGSYLQTGTTEADVYPTPANTGTDLDPSTMPATWKQLKFRLPTADSVKCGYVTIAGTATTGSVGPQATAMGFVKPAKNWYYVLARCNMEGNAAVDSYYLTSSESSQIKLSNPGR